MTLHRIAAVAAVSLAGLLALAGRESTPALADDSAAGSVKLEKLSWADFQKRIASNKGAKWTIVDAWATNCGPCKENFPHLVEMHKKYGDKGLAVVSLSLDDPTDDLAVADAEKFLKEKNATFTNVLFSDDSGDGYDALKISSIPAVFLYGPDGKEVKRFTMDDPNDQFTYEDVEREVVARLAGKASN
jgi:thiol-disulfide isomerase/thioredoxin